MNTTSLHALIVDQHFGELSPEVAELLETHLAQNAPARVEADRVRETLAVAGEAVMRHPELAQVEPAHATAKRLVIGSRLFNASWLAKAASIAVLATLTGTVGFFVGKKQETAPPGSALFIPGTIERTPRADSPWARYRIASESGGMQVVRVDAAQLNNPAHR
jgi:hypothetical protein